MFDPNAMYRSRVPALLLALAAEGAAEAETLSVQLRGVRSSHGEMQLDVYTPDRKHVRKLRVPARQGVLRVDVTGLAPGSYGIYVYHDENGNAKLDKGGLLGLPSEGYAFSNDAPMRFGPPSIDDMRVEIPRGGSGATVATLRYRK